MTTTNVLAVGSLPTPAINISVSQVEQCAADDALQGVPALDATTASPTEQSIVDACNQAYEELNRKSAEAVEGLILGFAQADDLPTEQEMNATEQRSEASVEAYFFESRQRLVRLQVKHEVAAMHWRYFRDRNCCRFSE